MIKMIEIVDVFVKNLISRVINISSVCLIGSANSGVGYEDASDIDIVVIFDDTEEVNKEYYESVIKRIAQAVSPKIHCQTFSLTEFWNYVENGSPVTFTILRDASIYYDTGFFTTMQKLVRKKVVKLKQESVERQLFIAKQLMDMTYHSVNKGLIQNLEGAIISSTQSLLIEMGLDLPAPKQIPDAIRDYLVSKKVLEEQYYNIARKVIQTFKDIEHNKRPNLSGQELQQLYNDTKTFVNRVEQVLTDVRKNKNL
ncbi:Uncharacterised protein [Candidatus Tiddalikarchaeum anstoanum]|nr:Uncharacterised protein [Candidatus Tiddalikarchaeum anstoanum]